MVFRLSACAAGVLVVGAIGACSSPFDPVLSERDPLGPGVARGEAFGSAFRGTDGVGEEGTQGDTGDLVVSLGAEPAADAYIRYALYHSPAVEAAYQRWLAAAERVPQVGALPDPRLTVGFFLDEVETRVGAQQARVGLSQSFPWFGVLEGRKDAASLAARAAWRRFEASRLEVTERVVTTLHELAYLDAGTRITRENLELLGSFEDVVRARYRVGAGSHPELVRVQVELGQLEDRLARLEAMRPAYVAELNAAMNRPWDTPVALVEGLPGRVVDLDGPGLAEVAGGANPTLLAMDEEADEQRVLGELARKAGNPDFTVGLDYIVTDDAMNSSIPESGDDPIMLSFGMTLPIWREKYDAGVRESVARRLAVTREREEQANRLGVAIQKAWFEHTDADRRVRLYQRTLIPKARESLRASLAGFRGGEAGFLDLLDTERTLLEFAMAEERAKADRGQALARLGRLVGEALPTREADSDTRAGEGPASGTEGQR